MPMKINPKTRFSKNASSYDQYRPSYPDKLIDWIISTTKIKPLSLIVDFGCGTGISTRLFSERGFRVIGIDPNEKMLEQAVKIGGGAQYQIGDSEKTNLERNIADLCISAQAFHWFDLEKANQEIKRILKPGSYCCAFWNMRIKTIFAKEYEKLLRTFSSDYEKTPKADEAIAAIKKSPSVKEYKEKEFKNSQSFDQDGLVGRAYSTSYVAHGVKEHGKFKNALINLFNKYEKGGYVSFKYQTKAICWQFA